MARALVPVTTCDHCGVQLDPMVRSDSLLVTVDGRKREYVADLCETGQRAFLEQVAVLQSKFTMTRVGAEKKSQPKSKPKAPPASGSSPDLAEEYRTCTLCSTVSKTRQGLGFHVKKYHGVLLSEAAVPLPKR